MVCLNEKQSIEFLKKVIKGLENPCRYVPTPDIKKAIEKVLKEKIHAAE